MQTEIPAIKKRTSDKTAFLRSSGIYKETCKIKNKMTRTEEEMRKKYRIMYGS